MLCPHKSTSQARGRAGERFKVQSSVFKAEDAEPAFPRSRGTQAGGAGILNIEQGFQNVEGRNTDTL